MMEKIVIVTFKIFKKRDAERDSSFKIKKSIGIFTGFFCSEWSEGYIC